MNMLTCNTATATMGSMTGMYGAVQNTATGFATYMPGSMYMTAPKPTSGLTAAHLTQLRSSVFRTASPSTISRPSWTKAAAAGVALAGLTAVTEAKAAPMDLPETSEQSAAHTNYIPSPYALPIIGGTVGLMFATIIGVLAWLGRSRSADNS